MKKLIITCLAAVTMFTAANAQTTTDDRLKPVAGTWGLGFSLNGLANIGSGNWQTTGLESVVINDPYGIIPQNTTIGSLLPQEMLFARYYFTDKLALRVAFGLNSLGTKTTGEDTAQGGIYQITENKLSAFSFGIGGGVEYHCADNSRRIDPYFGGQLNFGMIGPIKQTYNYTYQDNPVFTQDIETKWKGGTSFSLDAVVGANVFIAKNFALGVESNLGWGTVSFGGEYTQNAVFKQGNTITETNTRGVLKNRTSGFRVGSASTIRLAFYF
jgi:hypothetical protein